ncbi:hypothetical protein L3Q82_009176 [Scortum barcoo]|uniref:Uncharacterized protein n=1 Tax=Scortum barcoo TaxID=214431 RepID=A0ACB8XAW8_9TELE|nr:hypothetical protein L3Q82_009176 [Scortum barcoo]
MAERNLPSYLATGGCRPYDCTINLLPGAPLPASRLYNLSKPDKKAMESYIKDSLGSRPSRTSPLQRDASLTDVLPSQQQDQRYFSEGILLILPPANHPTVHLQIFSALCLSQPRSHISVNFVNGHPLSEGNTTILTIGNSFSKSVHFVPLPQGLSPLGTANLLVTHVFLLHGTPQELCQAKVPSLPPRSGKCFVWGPQPVSSGYDPQTNCQTEQTNQSLKAFLWCVASYNRASWSTKLPWVECAHNSQIT